MIREINNLDIPIIKGYLEKDIARNYFILLGLLNKDKTFNKIYGQFEKEEIKGLLFLRNSGTLQFYAREDFDGEAFAKLIRSLDYKGLIGAKSYCHRFIDKGIFSSFSEGAYISKFENSLETKDIYSDKLHELKLENLDEVVDIYKEVFTSFSKKSIMEEKLISKRGRGIYYKDQGRILSLAQTELETNEASLIVGVATRKAYQNKGYASLCLKKLMYLLRKENKNIYLQYDNLEAGRIYEGLGFRPIDRVIHYIK